MSTLSKEIFIEKLKRKDLESFYNVLNTVLDNLETYYSKEAIDAEKEFFSRQAILRLLEDKNSLLLTAKVGSKVIGIRVAQFEANTLSLYLTGILPQYQRLGIATQIHQFTFKYLKEKCPNVHKVWCDTRTNNKKGISILEKLGYKKIATLTNHWYGLDYYLWEKIV